MNLLIHAHALTVALAASYVTLLVANPPVASRLVWIYAITMLILAVVNLVTEQRHRHGR